MFGQAKSLERFAKRQKEHARKNNDAYQFTIIGRGNPGRDLDHIEEFFIRVGVDRETQQILLPLCD